MSRCAALVTGAGASARMAGEGKKEYRLLNGVPVLARSLLAFKRTGLFGELVATVPPGHVSQARGLIRPFLPDNNLRIIEGGSSRQESVYLGLRALADKNIDYVLIHDAARPWVTENLIRAVIKAAEEHGAAIPVIDVTDALVELRAGGWIRRHLSKTRLQAVQTPQGFRFQEIWAAHQRARTHQGRFYDDAQILRKAGKRVFTLPGDPANRKITHPHDLEGV